MSRSVEPPPARNTLGTAAATVAAVSLVLGLIVHPIGLGLGVLAMLLGGAGVAQAVRTDVGLARSLFALLAGLFVASWSALLLFSVQ